MNKYLLISDDVHFHSRNFSSLLALLEQREWTPIVHRQHRELMRSYGDYRTHQTLLQPYLERLPAQAEGWQALADFQAQGVSVFAGVKAELLCFLMPQLPLYQQPIPSDDRACLELLWPRAVEHIRLNCAAFLFWLEHWEQVLGRISASTKVLVFSGGCLYARALLELCRRRQCEAYVCEQSFTGHEYYIEERYGAIANQSAIGDQAYYRALLRLSEPLAASLSARAHQCMAKMHNKNVRQPEPESPITFAQTQPVVLLLAQVVNDFSLLCSDLDDLNSLSWYRKILERLMNETSLNVVVKCHPWEQQKVHLREAASAQQLQHWVDEHGWSTRVRIVSEHNLYALFEQAWAVVTLNSQAGIEAAYHGLKPIQLGRAFYGGKGFSYDLDGVDELVTTLQDPSFSGTLTLSEYTQLERFLGCYLVLHLHTEGARHSLARLHSLLRYGWQTCAEQTLKSLSGAATAGDGVFATARALSAGDRAGQIAQQHSRPRRLIKKMIRNPRKFLLDSRNPVLRKVATLQAKRGL